MDQKIIFVLSNGSSQYYPKNTLTNFTNKLPIPIDLNPTRKFEIGVASYGFSSQFRNVALPINKVPSFIISNCNVLQRMGTCVDDNDSNSYPCEVPVRFKFRQNEDGKDCNNWPYFLKDKEYTEADIANLATIIKSDSGVELKYHNNRLSFSVSDEDARSFKQFWVMLHKTFVDSFGFQSVTVTSKSDNPGDVYSILRQVRIGDNYLYERQATYKNEDYYVYHIAKKVLVPKVKYLDSSLVSDTINLSDRIFPKFVRIVCDNIQPQIFDSSFSKDLVIFTPDYAQKENYTFKEIESIDYIPLLNSQLSEIKIRLLDETGDQLQLLAGHASFLKMVLKEVPFEKKSFNLRLTSRTTETYPDNLQYRFKVRLPSKLNLDSTWRVCLNSINHPALFSTFLPEKNTRQIIFRKFSGGDDVVKYIFMDNYEYSNEILVAELNKFLTEKSIGSCQLNIFKKCIITVTEPGTFYISQFLAKILGHTNGVHEDDAITIKLYGTTEYQKDPTTGAYTVEFENPMEISYLKPNYLMMYSNIVKSTIVGGEHLKLLRVIPMRSTDLEYVISEFKHKEFYELENNEVDVIEIILTTHDGRYANFIAGQDVIVNLELSNYIE